MAESLLDRSWNTVDASPPAVQLAAGGRTVDAGAAVTILPERDARSRALVQFHLDELTQPGRLWVRFDGVPAAPGYGEAVYPGGQWSEWTSAAVSVYFEGTGTCRVSTSEVAA